MSFDFNIDTLLKNKLGVTPLGALGAYFGSLTGSNYGIVAGTMIGNQLNQPVGETVLQLWNGYVGYRVQFWAEKIKLDYEFQLKEYKRGKLQNAPTRESVVQSPSFIHAENLNKLGNRIREKVNRITIKRRKAPDLPLIGPLLMDAEYFADSKVIRELFSNLVAASVNKDYEKEVHLAFAAIIKQLSPHDAKFLMELPYQSENAIVSYYLINKNDEDNYEVLYNNVYLKSIDDVYDYSDTLSIENLDRLGIIKIDLKYRIKETKDSDLYEQTDMYYVYEKNHLYNEVQSIAQNTFGKDGVIEIEEKSFMLTDWGMQFMKVCVLQGQSKN